MEQLAKRFLSTTLFRFLRRSEFLFVFFVRLFPARYHLIHRPRILILDEPMVGIDPQGALALRRLLAGLAASGVTIFLSTHSLAVAEELCDRIAILDAGRLVAIGSLPELRERVAERPDLEPFDSSLEAVFLSLTGTTGGQV